MSNVEKYLELASAIAKNFPTLVEGEAEVFVDKVGVNQQGDNEDVSIVPGTIVYPISVHFKASAGLVFDCCISSEDQPDIRFEVRADELADLVPAWGESIKAIIQTIGNPGISDELHAVNTQMLTEIGSRRLVTEKFQRVVDSVDKSTDRIEEKSANEMDDHYTEAAGFGLFG